LCDKLRPKAEVFRSMSINASKFVIASRELVELARASQAAGDGQLAKKFFKAAAEVELASDELQDCWGGAFNGQEGRRALFLDLVERLELAAIVQTGTFRGSTTQWMAEHFDGPILTCEHAPEYFFQAQQRLSRFALPLLLSITPVQRGNGRHAGRLCHRDDACGTTGKQPPAP
jgi:hypothetical protein